MNLEERNNNGEMDQNEPKKKLQIKLEKNIRCMWVPGKKGVLAKVGNAQEISKAFGLVHPMSFKELKENARFVTLSDSAELISVKEMMSRKKEMEEKGLTISIV
ncbi:MAG: hypothetical protein J1E16_02375 [Muribaculaceae bacterium]|nr:hypothetical protein [Muribaculaceae bacterium]